MEEVYDTKLDIWYCIILYLGFIGDHCPINTYPY
jgi:hypothetical protein